MPNSQQGSNWDNANPFGYNDLGSINEFDLFEGVFPLPLAANLPTDPDELAAFQPTVNVRVHLPYRIRKMFFKGKRAGAPPILPSPTTTGAFQFLEGNLMFQQPAIDSNQTGFIFEANGAYTFVETCRSDVSDGFVLNNNPFISIPQQFTQTNYQPTTITFGAIAQAGVDAQIAYTQAASINFGSIYSFPFGSFWPGQFFNQTIANGDVATVLSPPATIPLPVDPPQPSNGGGNGF